MTTARPKSVRGTAITALVLGIISTLVGMFSFFIAASSLFGILGIGFSIYTLKGPITPNRKERLFSLWGIWLSIIGILIPLTLLAILAISVYLYGI